MIIIPNNKIDVFLCVYDVNYETGEYKTKALNSKNKEIFTEYDKIEAIQNVDESNNLWYEENVLKVQKNGKWGLVNMQGKELLKSEYDEITAMKGIKNSLLIRKEDKIGVANDDGSIILDVTYAEVTNLGKDNKSGFIVKTSEGKYGIVDYSKNQVLEPKYEGIKNIYGNDLYVVIEAGKEKIINKQGEEIGANNFDSVAQILKSKDAGIIFIKDEKYGVMNLNGEIIIAPEYENLKEAKEEILIAKKDGKTGIIDMSKTEKVPFNFTSITYNELADIYIAEDEEFNSNMIDGNFDIRQTGILIALDTEKGYFELRQDDEYKYFNLKFEPKEAKDILTQNTLFISKKEGKYGFVDKDGKVIVDYIYDDATEQNACGYVAVKKDGKWGSIDNKGEVVIEPSYNLDDYLNIDFIGRWHMGKDLNMDYYNQI